MKFDLDKFVKKKDIYLSYKGLVDDDLDVLIKVIEKSTVLEKLYLHDNNLTLADGKLADAIAKSRTLKSLQIHGNNIGPEGIKLLADALKENNTPLRVLGLGGNIIGDEGAKCIAEMLAVNKTLQYIGLGNNKIGKILRRNNIGDKGAEHLANALLENTTLDTIKLFYNKIGDRGAEKFADALKSNHSIKTLDLWNNKVSRDVKKRIEAILGDPKRKIDAALKEKEVALKLVASMKTDITRKEEEIEKKEQEIKIRDTDIAQRDQETERLKNELADAQKKVVTIGQEKDTTIANKDQQLKSALQEIAKRDKDIANKNKQLEQLHSIKRILNPARDDGGEPATKRTRTEDTHNKAKVKSVPIHSEHTDCGICASKYSADLDNEDDNIRKHLPVLSSSKTCDHYFCHGCVLNQQTAIAEENSGRIPKWIPCMVCKTKTAFCPSEPKYHRLLIDILKKAEWVDAPQVKEEPS